MCRPTGESKTDSWPSPPPPRIGDQVELQVESLAYGGAGVARLGALVVLVEGGIPGDRLMARVTRRARTFVRASLVQILSPSALRQPPPCVHFQECGGCAYQDLGYSSQLEVKRQQVSDLLARIGGFHPPPVSVPLSSRDPLRYRTRMTYSSSAEPGSGWGLHRRAAARSILEVPSCLLPREALQEAYRKILPDLRSLTPRERPSRIRILSGDDGHPPLALLLGRHRPGPRMVHLARRWTHPGGPLSGAVWAMEARAGKGGGRRVTRPLAGRGSFEQRLGPYRFRIPAVCFFQVHPELATRLFEEVAARRRGIPGEVLELYGGVGALTVFLAGSGQPILMVEGDPDAVRAARENARMNGITSVVFFREEVGAALRRFEAEGRSWATVVLDPPRTGLPPGAAGRIGRLARERILYLSCDPATLARDLREMARTGEWSLREVVPVDLFPQTAGIECLAELGRSAGR